MKFTTVIVAAASAVAVMADYGYGSYSNNTVSTTTTVVDSYVTYCPYATTFYEGTQTYVVTAPTTITVTNCPCTRTLTCSTTTTTSCPPTSTAVYVPPTTTPCPSSTAVYVPPPVYNTTVPVAPPSYTGAASSMKMASGALVAVFGAAAMLL
ncbi:hypothetical protein TWF694_009809 [Orbilia ellipsospora]|uniref:Clock-controlled protein 6 n=1 Tax=Orbilia ellipsospora TaxID=2528407 RepID=A0AAV9XBZ2_9PEZI